MLGKKRLFSAVDDDVEYWFFLVLERESQSPEPGTPVAGWQAVYGNPEKMTRSLGSKGPGEGEILEELLREIRHCRREGATLVTFRAGALPRLRTRMLLRGLGGADFRGVRHICVEGLLKNYYGMEGSLEEIARALEVDGGDGDDSIPRRMGEGGKVVGSPRARILWEIFRKVGPMLPGRCLEGPPL